MVDEVFDEEPVPLSVFVQDKGFLNNPPLSDEQFWAVRYVEQIYYPSLYEAMAVEFGPLWTPVRMINFATLMWGKGGGKDHVCRMMSLRVAYLLLCLKSPQQYYKMPPQDTIHMLNVAASSGQAQTAFFTPMKRAVKTGWFKGRANPTLNIIEYDKHVQALSGHSDAETQEGMNLILGVADEIDAFKSKTEMIHRAKQAREPTNSSEAILEMLQTSASTRFPEIYKNVRISYPRYHNSKIMQLTDEARADFLEDPEHSRHYVSGPKCTWDVNPRVHGPEQFREDYRKDPVLARAKYECRPAPAISPYFRNEQQVRSCFAEPEEFPPVTVEYACVDYAVDRGVVSRWDVTHLFSPSLRGVGGAAYSLHVDLALTQDRAGVCLSHVERWEEFKRIGLDEEGGEVELTEMVPYVKVDFCFSYFSDIAAQPVAREIQIRWARQLVQDLRIIGIVVQRVSYDTFQSHESTQLLRDIGIEAEKVSTDRDPSLYTSLRDLMYRNGIKIPHAPLCLKEILALQKLVNGKLDHPPEGSKDEADALAASVFGAIEMGGAESEQGEELYLEESGFEVLTFFEQPVGFENLTPEGWRV
jgi:hypothetical protein